MRGYWAILCFSVALSACGGGTTADSTAKAEAQQRQSEVGTAALGTARLQ